jgi:hypothetical protein
MSAGIGPKHALIDLCFFNLGDRWFPASIFDLIKPDKVTRLEADSASARMAASGFCRTQAADFFSRLTYCMEDVLPR